MTCNRKERGRLVKRGDERSREVEVGHLSACGFTIYPNASWSYMTKGEFERSCFMVEPQFSSAKNYGPT